MAFYLVKAKPRTDILESLHGELISGKVSKMKPFGKSLQYSRENTQLIQKVAISRYGSRKTFVLHHKPWKPDKKDPKRTEQL